MNQEPENGELLPLNLIRTETVLSRFPVHRLSKRGNISIDINEKTDAGEIKTKWEVSYNTKYGQPGPLAYKVDSLIINRRIEEAPRPLPKIIKLGSLRDLCRELDLNEGQATQNVKKALLQNASAFITSKRTYKGNDGIERTAEISDTRYGVIFTGEKFPDGGRADAVYIMLHDAEVLSSLCK
jgi:predicted  nucleic acid-binding Zn ribbon protein